MKPKIRPNQRPDRQKAGKGKHAVEPGGKGAERGRPEQVTLTREGGPLSLTAPTAAMGPPCL